MANIKNENKVVTKMIRLYCRKHRHQKQKEAISCPQCAQLAVYAAHRLQQCRYSNEKPRCKNCTTHCYAKEQREKIQQVMREIGPSMIFKMPFATLKYLLSAK